MAIWSGESFRNCFKDAVGWIFMVSVIAAFILLVIMKAVSPNRFATIEDNKFINAILDTRCICICPHHLETTSKHNRTVFMKKVFDPSKCSCRDVVFDANELVCLQCECSFESRNAILIGSIVYTTLLVAFCCMPPCACVVCLQPWIKVKLLRTYAGPSLHSQGDRSRIMRVRRTSYNRVDETPT